MPRIEMTFEYLPELEISRNYPSFMADNCAVIERTADGKSVGACGFYLKEGTTCPRHGIVRRLSQKKSVDENFDSD